MYSPDGTTLIIGGRETVEAWYTSSNQHKVIHEYKYLANTDDYRSRIAYDPDGKTLAICDFETQLRDVDTGQRQVTLPLKASSPAYSPDGRTLVTQTGVDGMVRLWDPDTGKHKAAFYGWRPIEGQRNTRSGYTSIVYSPDGTTLAIKVQNSSNTVGLWDAATGVHKATLTIPTGVVNSLAYSPDGTTLATVGNDGTILLWALTPKSTTK